MFMFSFLKNKTPKTISHQIITPLKRIAFSLLMAFSLFSYSANATEMKPIAFSTGIDISEGPAGTVVILTHPDHPATTVFSNTFVNTVKVPLSAVSISEGPITSLAIIIPAIPDQTICAEEPIILSVSSTTGKGTLIYQWQKDGTNLSDGVNISGSTTETLTINTSTTSDAGIYSCEIIDDDLVPTLSNNATIIITA